MMPAAGYEPGAARQRASDDRRRAEQAAMRAGRHERLAAEGNPSLAEFHHRLARLHRGAERAHLASAAMHSSFADRLQRWCDDPAWSHTRPRFMASVAEAVDAPSTSLVLFAKDGTQAITCFSDDMARAAQDLEFVYGEGPVHDQADSPAWITADAALTQRWPQYGRAVTALGVRHLVAAPLRVRRACLGALVAFNPGGAAGSTGGEHVQGIADGLVVTLLGSSDPASEMLELLTRAQSAETANDDDLVNVATGMVAVQQGCDVQTALALIRARAFADGQPTQWIARRIAAGELRFD